jgi:hypothetical protein
VAAIPLGLGLLGPGAHGTGWSLLVSAMMSVSLYWRRRAAFAVLAVCFALGLAQVTSWTDFTRILGPGEDTEVAVKGASRCARRSLGLGRRGGGRGLPVDRHHLRGLAASAPGLVDQETRRAA